VGERYKKRVERVLVMLDEDELQTIDSWRFEHRMPSRSAAIRELLRKGLGDFQADGAVAAEKSEDFGVLHGPSD